MHTNQQVKIKISQHTLSRNSVFYKPPNARYQPVNVQKNKQKTL
jgi:hypothetical protein